MPPLGYRKTREGEIDQPQARADEIRQVRRRQRGVTTHTGIKLGVNEKALDRKTYQYRFARDTGNRVQQLEAQDWDKVSDPAAKDDSTGLGTVASAHGGVQDTGKPYDLVLMRKRKDWYDEDKAEQQARLDRIDDAIRRGNVAGQNTELKGPGVYTPNGGNTIEHVN